MSIHEFRLGRRAKRARARVEVRSARASSSAKRVSQWRRYSDASSATTRARRPRRGSARRRRLKRASKMRRVQSQRREHAKQASNSRARSIASPSLSLAMTAKTPRTVLAIASEGTDDWGLAASSRRAASAASRVPPPPRFEPAHARSATRRSSARPRSAVGFSPSRPRRKSHRRGPTASRAAPRDARPVETQEDGSHLVEDS